MGQKKAFEAQICMKDASPKFCKALPGPDALINEVKSELNRLEAEGIIEKVEKSDWASQWSLNADMVDQNYTFPTAEDILATLANGKSFTKN